MLSNVKVADIILNRNERKMQKEPERTGQDKEIKKLIKVLFREVISSSQGNMQ